MPIKMTTLSLLLALCAAIPAQAADTQDDDADGGDSAQFTCSDVARKCSEMSSCEEAEFALEHCGRAKLDRDDDGIPCENVCG